MAKHVAASAEQSAVKALVPLVAADTDDRIEVVIPEALKANAPHWTGAVDFVMPLTARIMWIHGAGDGHDGAPDGGGDKTYIYDDRTENDIPILTVTPNSNPSSTDGIAVVFGITFHQTNRSRSMGSLAISGHYNDPSTPQKYRVHHCHFITMARGLWFGGRVIGVDDHNVYECDGASAKFYNSWSDSAGDKSWAEPTGFGSPNFPIGEDNVYRTATRPLSDGGQGNSGVMDSYRGSRWVERFSDLDRMAFQTHPTGGSGRARGTRAFELYGINARNLGPNPGTAEFNFMFWSSGPGLIHYNDIVGIALYQNGITAHVNRRDGNPYLQAPTPDGWGYAGTTKTGVGSNWDGNQEKATGYPCLDQIGRGIGDLLVGDFGEGMINQQTGKNHRDPGAWPRQALEPAYVFGNIYEGGSIWSPSNGADAVLPNRDYFLDTGGRLGKGLVLPTVAGLPWDGFVKLDGGSWLKKTPGHGNAATPNFMLFVRDSAGLWKPYYQPLEYPHPFIALTKYDDGPIVIPPDPIPVPPDPVPVPPDPTPIPPDPTPVPPNQPPTVKFVKPTGIGAAYELITDGKVITVKQQYIKLEGSDDLGPVTLEIWIDNSLLARNSNGEKTLQVKWNTNPHKGRDPLITGKVTDAHQQTAEVAARVKVRH